MLACFKLIEVYSDMKLSLPTFNPFSLALANPLIFENIPSSTDCFICDDRYCNDTLTIFLSLSKCVILFKSVYFTLKISLLLSCERLRI